MEGLVVERFGQSLPISFLVTLALPARIGERGRLYAVRSSPNLIRRPEEIMSRFIAIVGYLVKKMWFDLTDHRGVDYQSLSLMR
jgi:hypothetical protein